MAAKKYGVFYVPLTQSTGRASSQKASKDSVKLAWRAPIDVYPDDIAKQLGVRAVSDGQSEPGLIFGSNAPRLARVRINVRTGQGKGRSYVVFANTGNLSKLIHNNSLTGKKYRGGTISSVSMIGTSTNPNRKKSSGSKKSRTTKNSKKTTSSRKTTSRTRTRR